MRQEPPPVSLRDRLHDDITTAMRSGDVLRRDTLRMVWSSVYAQEKRDLTSLSDDATLGVLTREVKSRRESVEAYRAGGREDLAAKEEAEIAIIAEYLPPPLTDDELRTVSYTHLRAHETVLDLVCRLLLEKKKNN